VIGVRERLFLLHNRTRCTLGGTSRSWMEAQDLSHKTFHIICQAYICNLFKRDLQISRTMTHKGRWTGVLSQIVSWYYMHLTHITASCISDTKLHLIFHQVASHIVFLTHTCITSCCITTYVFSISLYCHKVACHLAQALHLTPSCISSNFVSEMQLVWILRWDRDLEMYNFCQYRDIAWNATFLKIWLASI